MFKINTTFLELLNLLPSWVASPEDGSRQLPKQSVVLKICDSGKSPCEYWWHYSEGSAPQISKGTIWQNLKPITSPRILKTSFQKIQLYTELSPTSFSVLFKVTTVQEISPLKFYAQLVYLSQLQWHYNFFHGFVLSLFVGTRDSVFTSDAL